MASWQRRAIIVGSPEWRSIDVEPKEFRDRLMSRVAEPEAPPLSEPEDDEPAAVDA